MISQTNPFTSIACVVFDWDGTLTDTIPAIEQAYLQTCQKLCITQPERSAIRAQVGAPPLKALQNLFPKDFNDNFCSAFLTQFRIFYSQSTVRLFPGSLGLLKTLNHEGKKVAVASNKTSPLLLDEIKSSGLAPYIHLIHTASDFPAKPDPSMLITICENLNVPAVHTAMVGDHHNDILAAKNASVQSIGLLSGGQDTQSLLIHQPNYLFKSINDLYNAVTSSHMDPIVVSQSI